jgi:Aspartyl/Asparaginyl beta-hydroxylase
MVNTLKFPFSFDAGLLRGDLERFTESDWTPHFNTQYYEGDWSGISLRMTKNAHVPLYSDPTVTVFVNTEMMSRCDYIPRVLSSLKCDIQAVRFLRLGPGDEILEHRDYGLNFENGAARIHVPVKTSPEVEFYLGGKPVPMNPGEAWYLNFDLNHSVKNSGSEERVHLVIDCLVNDWLASFFP